ncbi:MAG TPA: glycosyltransferase family 4 protein [Rhizomicrobium sp.]|jgi:glycosyltransferase involved in cell wall biosynthesis
MKIAQIAPLVESVPPKLYGGTERVVSWLTEELVRQGHDVTLFASGDSITNAELDPVVPRALRLDGQMQNSVWYNLLMLERVAERADEFDMLHFHIDFFQFPVFRHIVNRTLTTLHGRLDLPEIQPLYRVFNRAPLVSISNSQREPMPPVNWRGTVYHGLPADQFHMVEKPKGYLAFLGRISPEKNPEGAIAIAERAGLPLKIAAKVDAADREYYDSRVAPLIARSPHVEFIGEINESQKQIFLGNARALLFPIDWPEPFGIVMIEALACGTPVIAFDRGSVSEVIEDGLSGFIVETVDEAVEALQKIDRLSRKAVRARFDLRYSSAVMAARYVDIYKKLLSESPAAAREAA